MKAKKTFVEFIKQQAISERLLITILCFSALWFVSCEEDLPIPERINKVSVYMQDAGKSPIVKNIDPDQEISFKIGGVACRKEAEGDLEVSLEADMSLVRSYNMAVAENYIAMVESSYTFSGTLKVPEGIIQSDSITIHIQSEGKLEEGEKYLLPIRIKSIDGRGRILQNSEVSYVVITVGDVTALADYDKTGWEVVGYSSEELNGEGPVQGRAALVIDNNTETFWHSQYTGGGSAPPHFITVDMKEERPFRAFWILNVQEEWGDSHFAYPMKIHLEISNNGNDWTKVLEVEGTKTRDKQLFRLPGDFTARYFKIVIEKCELLNGDERTYAYLSEIGISYALDE